MNFVWQRGWGGNRSSLPYLVFILSLAATVCAWVWAGLVVDSQDRHRFSYATEEAENAIKDRVDYEVDLLRSTAATYYLQGGWSRGQFHTFVDSLALGDNNEGSQGIGFIRRINREQAADLTRRLAAEGVPDFHIYPPTSGQEKFPIVYLEPQTPVNLSSVGYDAATEPARWHGMMAARDTGLPTLSGIITSGEARPGGRIQNGFLLYCPIYSEGRTPDTAAERRHSLVGFVYSRFRGGDMFRNVLEGEARKDLDVEIFDVPADGRAVRFYASSRATGARHAKMTVDGYVSIEGRRWLIRYYSSASFEEQSAAWLVNWILIMGILTSTLLGAISFSQVRAYRQLNDQAGALARRESQVRRLNENLEHLVGERTTELQVANRELEAFCYSVSHDLRAPLRSVDGFSKSLLEDYGELLDNQGKDYIARVRSATHRMDELITALLNLSRITRQEIVKLPIDLTHMACLSIDEALEGPDKDRFHYAVQPGMKVEADPKLIRVLLDNLIRNAVKFSAPVVAPRIEVGFDGVAFFVRDNGVGFNPAYGHKLFIAFERLHGQAEFPGSGIGLATAERIVQKHAGRIWAESEEGKGATFYFTVP